MTKRTERDLTDQFLDFCPGQLMERFLGAGEDVDITLADVFEEFWARGRTGLRREVELPIREGMGGLF